jgi:hypothetical protein
MGGTMTGQKQYVSLRTRRGGNNHYEGRKELFQDIGIELFTSLKFRILAFKLWDL